MKVCIKKVGSPEQEQVVLECMELTKDFKEIQEYAMTKGEKLSVYEEGKKMKLICQEDILYLEAVGELVFAYTPQKVYEVKARLYELEERLREKMFLRCSKSVLLNIRKVLSLRPALNGRFLAEMENKEEIMISRQYAKTVKKCIMEEL